MPNQHSACQKLALNLAGVLTPQIELSEGRYYEQKCKTRLPGQPARVWVLEAGGALCMLWRMTLEGQKWPKMAKNDQKSSVVPHRLVLSLPGAPRADTW